MKILISIFTLMLSCLVLAFDEPVQLVYPWVSYNQQFSSTLFVTNHADSEAALELIATRTDGTQFTATEVLKPHGFLKKTVERIFPDLDEGSGFSVQLKSANTRLTGRWLTFNRQIGSSGSPSLGLAVPPGAQNHPSVGQELTLDAVGGRGNFTSALVFLNLGVKETTVTLTFADSKGNFLETFAPIEVDLDPFVPVAKPVAELVGDISDLSVHAVSSGQPVTTVHFMFNEAGEPAMASGTNIYPESREPAQLSQKFDFSEGDQHFSHDFSDYPANNSEIFAFTGGVSPLPAPFSGTGYQLSARNASDDVFMYLTRRINGLAPNTRYEVGIEATFLSNAGTDCIGIGGAPGESVFVKFGASQVEPAGIVGEDGYVVFTLDKGNQGQEGRDLKLVGNIATDVDCDGSSFQKKTLQKDTLSATSDQWGNIWITLGTDSGFEGTTELYFEDIQIDLKPAAP